jgi:hypothetical protein
LVVLDHSAQGRRLQRGERVSLNPRGLRSTAGCAREGCRPTCGTLRASPPLLAEAVAERNWIFFDDDARFEASLAELIETLDTDLDWVKTHTRLLVRAGEWTDGSGDRSRLNGRLLAPKTGINDTRK